MYTVHHVKHMYSILFCMKELYYSTLAILYVIYIYIYIHIHPNTMQLHGLNISILT